MFASAILLRICTLSDKKGRDMRLSKTFSEDAGPLTERLDLLFRDLPTNLLPNTCRFIARTLALSNKTTKNTKTRTTIQKRVVRTANFSDRVSDLNHDSPNRLLTFPVTTCWVTNRDDDSGEKSPGGVGATRALVVSGATSNGRITSYTVVVGVAGGNTLYRS